MKLIDMHVHTTASDGSCTPSEVCRMAIDKDLAAIAITDHDTVDGVSEALTYISNIDSDIEIIPGIELSSIYKGTEIHILGFYMDYTNPELNKCLENVKKARLDRNLAMCRLFQNDGIEITLEKLQSGHPDTVITRAHFARVLIEEGICKNKDQAFKKYLNPGCKYYIPVPDMSSEDAIELIARYGKASFLAHPLLYNMSTNELDEMIAHFAAKGLTGIEVYHSSTNSYDSGRLRSFATKYNLLTSGGSDFHGIIKPDIELGSGRGDLYVTSHHLTKLKEHCGLI
ncbi:MAG: PHP domain-containing protein [Coprococcus sp.]